MAVPITYDVLLVGYRNDLARVRTQQFLDGRVTDAAKEVLPRRLYTGLDAATAEDVRRELASLGAQVNVVPVGLDESALASVSLARRAETTPRRSLGLITLVVVGVGAILLVSLSARLQQRPKKTVTLNVTRQQRDEPLPAVQIPAPAAVPMDADGAAPDDPRAVQLNNEALSFARRKEYDPAVRKLRAALAISPGSPVLSKNLQAVLISWGVTDLDAGDLDGAQERLEDASSMGDHLEALYALGVVYTRRADLSAARTALERALAVAPHDGRVLMSLSEVYLQNNQRPEGLSMLQRARDAGIRGAGLDQRIDQLAREVDAEWDYVEHTSPHFRISFADDEDLASVQTVLQAMEDAYHVVGSRLNYYLDERVAVVLYTQRDFHDITRTPDWAGGAFDGRIKLPVRGLESDDDLQLARVARHELAHAVVHKLSGGRCPVWLNEGIAVWAEELEEGERLNWANERLSEHPLFRFSALEGSFTAFKATDAEAAYAQSYLAVRQLVDRYGARSLRDLLQALRTQPLEQAFSSALRDNFNLFEQRFVRDNANS